MKKVFKRILIATAVMVTSLTAGIFASCTYGADQEEMKKKEGYSYCVTYDANGGTFGSNSTRTYALVKENSLTPAPGYVDAKTQASVKVPTRRNFQLIGEAKDDNDDETNDEAILTQSWYLAATDENGDVIYEGEGENRTPVLASDTPWDFTKDKVTSDITLVAQWREVFRFVLCLTETNENGETVEKELRSYTVDPGATIADKLYNKGDDGELVRRADYIRVNVRNYTLLDFYMDKELTTLLDFSCAHPGRHEEEITVIDPETNESVTQTVESNEVKIYVKYLAGSYQLITNENKKVLSTTSNWYLLEDVDFEGETWDPLSKFTGTIYGNGFALKNLTVTSIVTIPKNGKDYTAHSIFGTINGMIKDLTLENVTLQLTTRFAGTQVQGEQRATFLAYGFGDKADVEQLTLKDCKILLSDSTCYTTTSGGFGSMWYETAPEEQVKNVVIQENGVVVESVKIESV